MMRRTREVVIGDLVKEYLRTSGLETPYLYYQVIHAWSKILPKELVDRTTVEGIFDQKIWIRVHTPALRTQLAMQSERIVQQLNKIVGEVVIYGLKLI